MFTDSAGPKSTPMSTSDIADAIDRIGRSKSWMSFSKRLGLALNGSAKLQPFSPTPDDDPFSTTRPDFSVGWAWGVRNPATVGPSDLGFRVIFAVMDDGSSRRVIAKTTGNDGRATAKKLVKAVFAEL